MPDSTTTLLVLGVLFGALLVLCGVLIGYWFGKRIQGNTELVETPEQRQFVHFLSKLSRFTDQLSGDVNTYQNRLSTLSRDISLAPDNTSTQELSRMLHEFMLANRDLQSRLDDAEERLEDQTKEIANYLTEARTDGLTGLANRRAFDSQLDDQFAQFEATRTAFSLALVDIDFFKKINDTHGHPIGDSVLREMAKRLTENLPEALQVARFGGEEFAILLPGSLEMASHRIDQLRQLIVSAEIEADDLSLPVTLSCGVAEVQDSERIGKLVRRADEALYAAKLGGRNRVYKHDGKLCHLVGNAADSRPGRPIGSDGKSADSSSSELSTTGPMEKIRQQLQQRLDRIVAEETKRQKA